MNKGVVSVLVAYLIWGLYPFYFHAMQHVAPTEIVIHRVLWTFALLAVYLFCSRRWRWIQKAITDRRTVAVFLMSSVLITANWSTYTYAIVTNQTLEASLGYFMNPLVSVLLGTVFLKEKLNKAQMLAIVFACAGVMWVTFKQGEFPALGLTLALSFGFYGLVRKMAPLGSLEGLTLETAFLFCGERRFNFRPWHELGQVLADHGRSDYNNPSDLICLRIKTGSLLNGRFYSIPESDDGIFYRAVLFWGRTAS